jgi:3-hydroxybutyryl-CoA dehydrogenase
MQKITVIGAGTMGAGIAQVAAEAGCDVAMVDTEQRFLDKGVETISKMLSRKVEKGTVSQDKLNAIMSKISTNTDMAKAVAGAVMVIEAVFENMDIKKKVFQEIDGLCPQDVILASNTSGLSITEMAIVTKHPDRVIGTHFFSPVPMMKLVEVIRGKETSEATANKAIELCKLFGKTPVIVKDIPGFIVNRFLGLLYCEAANMIEKGQAGAKDIDTALKLGCNWPMGMVELMDAVGVDVIYRGLTGMYAVTRDERYKPSPLFKQMFEEKRWGRKTGRGFYDYEKK